MHYRHYKYKQKQEENKMKNDVDSNLNIVVITGLFSRIQQFYQISLRTEWIQWFDKAMLHRKSRDRTHLVHVVLSR